MTTDSQDLGLTSHPKDGAFYSIVFRHYTGALGPTQTAGSQPCLASVGNRSWAARLYGC